jgi:hypothetical protein
MSPHTIDGKNLESPGFDSLARNSTCFNKNFTLSAFSARFSGIQDILSSFELHFVICKKGFVCKPGGGPCFGPPAGSKVTLKLPQHAWHCRQKVSHVFPAMVARTSLQDTQALDELCGSS